MSRLPDGLVADALGQAPGPDGRGSRGWRRLLEWSATSAPVALLLLTGVALGPRGINLLSADALSLLDTVVPVALAALGVLVGLSVGDRRTDDRRVFAAACLEAAFTMLVVSAGIAAVALAARSPVVGPLWILVLAGGICAASSLTLPSGNPLEPRTPAIRIIELGVLLPIAVGGLALAWLRAGSFAGSVVLVAQAAGVTLALAAAAWLLLTQAPSETEERVLAASALLLVGGVAGRPLAVGAVRRTGRRCVLAICGTAPTRDDQPGCALRPASPPRARAAGGRRSCRSLAGVARLWRGLSGVCASSGSWRAAAWRGVPSARTCLAISGSTSCPRASSAWRSR